MFEFHRGGKLQNQLEEMANEFVTESVAEFYGVEDLESLSEEAIADLMNWYNSNCRSGYYEEDWYVESSFRMIINEWHAAHDQGAPL
jgi:hypothetical protein